MGPAANPSQLFINSTANTNPTGSSAPINRVRIELYPSANGSTTNMGWLVEIDQNLSGTFQPAVTGTNLTFANNTLPLTFGSSGSSSFVVQNPQSPVSIFSGPATNQVLAVGTPINLGVTVEGWYPAFQWYKFNGISYQPILNATNRSYTSPPVAISDNGDKFYVVVSNKLNSLNVVTSSVANVAVLIPNNLTWYPAADTTTWDTLTANWTTNGGVSETLFSGGNNVTFDSLGYNLGGNFVTVSNTVNPNAVTVNASSFDQYQWLAGNISGQSLLLTGDGTGTLELQTTASFTSATITNATLQIGYLAVDGALQANYITNYGTINFNNAGGLTIAGVFSGPGPLFQNGSGLTALTATNSAYTIGTISGGTLAIASTPNPGIITNNSALQPNSPASVLTIPNAMTGTGYYDLSGFQTTVLTGISSHTGRNGVVWSDVIVNNPWALGDTNVGSTEVLGADKFGGLYFSNSIVWSQLLQLDTRQNTGAEATAPHVANFNGNNVITGPLIFATGSAAGNYGTELNVDATTGQLTIAAVSSLTNNTISGYGSVDLNLQGSATGVWNGNLADGATPLNVVKRGAGTWTLGGSNVNSGTTTVSGGTLLITGQIGTNNVLVSGGTLGGNGGTIAGAVSVSAGGTLAPGGTGAGTLTIDNNLTLASGSFTSVKINKTTPSNDQLLGVNTLTYGGTLVVNNLAGAFAAISPASPGAGLAWNTNTLTTDGILRIATGIAMNRTNITAKVVSGYLQLSWPADHTGWRLLEQTNNLNKGVSTNILADWGTLAGSQLVNSTNITIIKTNLNEYFQLVYP
jgi:autotransporter-associated beta strand protein